MGGNEKIKNSNAVINIYVLGEYDNKTKVGVWTFYMEFKGAVMKRCGIVKNTSSATRMALVAFEQALDHINRPSTLHVHSNLALGFGNIKESRNKDILKRIQTNFIKAGHQVEYNKDLDMRLIDGWEINEQQKRYNNQNNTDTENSAMTKEQEDEIYDEMASRHKMTYEEMYADLDGPSNDKWVPGMGGY